ncbi:DNA repair protein RadC (plasmid) [Microbulbifer sp. CnH-101-G]|uniref:RadC family protein n=1 Tax=Microbulbifer sp. CnH-101-G TaxID=3243393 RepID=UPI0040399189
MFQRFESLVINTAKAILFSKLRKPGSALTSPRAVVDYLLLNLASLEREVFSVIYLDTQHRVIAYREEFQGTINAANVYPREIVKRALELNAAALIIAHNHPSGLPDPSQADIWLTERLSQALALVEIPVLDHIIIGGETNLSFAEKGLL